MRFNPPPNWPRLPEGWSPPPGWEPDPSWPKPPSGWRLWIPEEEFVISPYLASRSPLRSTQAWYRRTVAVVLFLIFCFPVGLVLLWLRNDWSVRRRGVVTAVVGIVVIIAATASPNPPPTTTTVLSPTAVGGTTAATSQSPVSSPSAVPSPVVTKPLVLHASAPSPSKTAAAAAPVHTSAAPVHTTKAPQPVLTTAAPQPVETTAQTPSCYPLTNGGNCYKPGEYCRVADHGASGIDGNGDAIKCEDNDGWRWERV